jgi:hypothetical protein
VSASKRVRLTLGIYILLGLIFVALGIAFEMLLLVGLGIWFPLWMFLIVPALRSRKRSQDIYLE